MLQIVGWDERHSHASKHHRCVKRQRSLLSESIRASPSGLGALSRESFQSVASLESQWSDSLDSPRSVESDCLREDVLSGTQPVEINYSEAARSRVEAAEAAGRARDEQLEMLHAVRQYMAQQQAKLLATRTC